MPIGSKEFDLLCACAAVEISPQRAARIAAAITAPDWNELLRLAEHHGVLPLLARTLKQQKIELPSHIRESLEQANQENIRRNLWFASELARILQHFENKNVRAIPYKGPVLAESVYGDLALRTFSDLDFLISPTDFDSARQALEELGYQPSEAWTAPVEDFWLKKGYERAFDGTAGKYLVELQWAVLPCFFAVDLRNDDLLARSSPSRLNDETVPQVRTRTLGAILGGAETRPLSPEDSLLVLCLHAAKHLWIRLLWLCDIAESMRVQPIDYALLLTRARELGALRMLGVSFWLAAKLLDADLTPEAQEVLTADREIAMLGGFFAERLACGASYDFESAEYFLLLRKLRERSRDRARYLWRLVWTPGVGDLASVSLPVPLFPLYRLVRLARLSRKLLYGAPRAT